MTWNFLKTFFRYFRHDKHYAIAQIGGLSIALASVILILVFVRDEFNYDGFWADAERIHRLEITMNFTGRPTVTLGTSMAGLKPLLDANVAGIEEIARIRDLPANTNLAYLDIIVPLDVAYISSVLSTQPANVESLWNYFSMLTYVKLVQVASYLMNQWLTGFAFRIDLQFAHFALPAILAFLIAWITVASHSFRVARISPANALRHE